MTLELSSLTDKADKLFLTREKRLEMQRQVEALRAEETALKNELIDSISKADATGVSGKLVRVTVVTKPQPQVKDWDLLWPYIMRRKAFDLVQRRLSDTAVEDRWEDGQTIPGVEAFPVVTLSMNRV